MKLLAKTSLIYLLSTALVFLIGGWIFYYNLRNIVDEEATEKIYGEKQQIEKFIRDKKRTPAHDLPGTDLISFDSLKIVPKEIMFDTVLYSAEEQEDLPYRCLEFPVNVNGKKITASVSKSLFESDDLVGTILTSFTLIILVLLGVTFIVNRIASNKLWKPFMDTVEKLKAYRIDQHEPLQLSPTTTREFSQLNDALEKMTEKISADYNNLKAFTENASHELQTPLSVIMASAENMLQQKELDEKLAEQIQKISQTAHRLSKLNQALLLLAKIGNHQFADKEEIDIGELINGKLDLYAELIAHKEIKLEINSEKQVKIKIHPVLADVIVTNLLANAIRHNTKGGAIRINVNNQKLVICNPGNKLREPEKLFGRFYKENISSESTGLGLALVKQAAEASGMKIGYSFTEGTHCFEITF